MLDVSVSKWISLAIREQNVICTIWSKFVIASPQYKAVWWILNLIYFFFELFNFCLSWIRLQTAPSRVSVGICIKSERNVIEIKLSNLIYKPNTCHLILKSSSSSCVLIVNLWKWSFEMIKATSSAQMRPSDYLHLN